MSRHLLLDDRIKIKKQLEENTPIRKIAENLGFSKSTIYYEIKKSMQRLDAEYDPYFADSLTKQNQPYNGPENIIGSNPILAQQIAQMILVDKMTIPNIVAYFSKSKEFQNVPTSNNTVYRAIDHGLIPGVTRESLRAEETRMFSERLIYIPKWACEKYGFNEGDTFLIRFSETGQIVLDKRTEK